MRGKNVRRPKSPRRYLPVHPVDERGLPVIPESINLECNPDKCRYKRPYKDRQHVMHPANEYRTPIEREYRNLGCFVITMCRCQHENWDRGIAPPKHVSNELMRTVIREYKQGEYTMERQGQLFDKHEYSETPETPELVPADYRDEYHQLNEQLADASYQLNLANEVYHDAVVARIDFIERLRGRHELQL